MWPSMQYDTALCTTVSTLKPYLNLINPFFNYYYWYLIYNWSIKACQNTVYNLALPSLQWGSLVITLTVPLSLHKRTGSRNIQTKNRHISCVKSVQWEEIKTKNSGAMHPFERKGPKGWNTNILLLYFPFWPESQKSEVFD